MDRRTFMGAVAANLVAVPPAAMAEQTEKVRRIGFLAMGDPPSSNPDDREWDPAALRDLGWIEGKNLVIERRYAGDRAELLQRFAAELVQLKVEIIVTNGTDAAVAAKDATTRIPIVIFSAGDPVGAGLVASLSRPGGNITGFSILSRELRVKRLEVLHELLPAAQRVGELVNPTNPFFRVARKEYEEAYRSLGMRPLFIDVAVATELGNAFAELARWRAQALVVPTDNLFRANSVWIMRAAVGQALPTMVDIKDMVKDGGLVSYTFSDTERDHRFAFFVDKILRGAKPADLPIVQPAKFELVINLKTAKTLGLTIPQSLLLRADEVIQ
jgi:putative ABC transport system substrate-binding protein